MSLFERTEWNQPLNMCNASCNCPMYHNVEGVNFHVCMFFLMSADESVLNTFQQNFQHATTRNIAHINEKNKENATKTSTCFQSCMHSTFQRLQNIRHHHMGLLKCDQHDFQVNAYQMGYHERRRRKSNGGSTQFCNIDKYEVVKRQERKNTHK